MRTCKTCLCLLSSTAFYAGKNACKECTKARQKHRYKHNIDGARDKNLAYGKRHRTPAVKRAQDLKAKYGLTLVDFDRLLVEQEGLCAICKRPPRGGRWVRLYVDHDHQTGNVRGLLCNRCNLGVGHFDDDASLLLKAAQYLQRSVV